ncbi:MAG: sugar ABC transporter permease [Candidatus Omnitrophica bacterium]|nr:sugar ABC transporter permease [Candidatus Omnitrophota bacterium]MCF7893812.1 sugar ABC transporter permease [Candidatus Omnitrophota bacterium]
MNKKEQLINFSFVAPALAIFSFFYIIPFFYTFWLSLHKASPTNVLDLNFVGAQNFKDIFSPQIFIVLVAVVGIFLILFALKNKFQKLSLNNKKGLAQTLQFATIAIGGACLIYAATTFITISRQAIDFNPDLQWWNSVRRSFYITLWGLTFQNCLAFILALGVDRATRTGKLYRVIFFLLPVLGEVIIGLLLRIMLSHYPGVFNHLLENIGLGQWAQNWLGKDMALATLAVSHCWRGFGYGFIILLAGLQTIPEQLYEAARIDGANAWHRFTKITVPMLVPIIFLVIILTILGTVQIIGLPMALTRGGPAGKTTVSVLRIFYDLNNSHVGYASAEGLILGLILVTLSFGMLKISKKMKS